MAAPRDVSGAPFGEVAEPRPGKALRGGQGFPITHLTTLALDAVCVASLWSKEQCGPDYGGSTVIGEANAALLSSSASSPWQTGTVTFFGCLADRRRREAQQKGANRMGRAGLRRDARGPFPGRCRLPSARTTSELAARARGRRAEAGRNGPSWWSGTRGMRHAIEGLTRERPGRACRDGATARDRTAPDFRIGRSSSRAPLLRPKGVWGHRLFREHVVLRRADLSFKARWLAYRGRCDLSQGRLYRLWSPTPRALSLYPSAGC